VISVNTHPLTKFLTCAAVFGLVAAFDNFTGYEVTSFHVYLIPIGLAFFYFGKKGGYLACVVAVAIWGANDLATGHVYPNVWLLIWGLFSRFLVYLLLVYGLSVYAKTVRVHRRRVEELERLLPLCHGCGRVLSSTGEWKTPEQVLEEEGDKLPECPDCAQHPEPRID
jgi:hypothetical protein